MREFKIGDIVECVRRSTSPANYPQVVGERYVVEDSRPEQRDIRVTGCNLYVMAERFELVTPETTDVRPEKTYLNALEEVRTTSSTGGQKGVKAQRYDLLPKAGLDGISEVFAFGAEKYDSHNWRKGYEWSKSYAAAMRHMTAHWDGQTVDDESGLPHLAHAGCHILFMLTWLHEQGEGGQFDDRFVNPSNKS